MGRALPFDSERKPSSHSVPAGEELSPEVARGNFGNSVDEENPEAYGARRELVDSNLEPWSRDFARVLRVYLAEVAFGKRTEAEVLEWVEKSVRRVSEQSQKLARNGAPKTKDQ